VDLPAGGYGLAVLLALVGAGCFALSSVLQHQEVRAGRPTDDLLPASRLLAVMRRPRWLAGLVLAVPGAVLLSAARTRRRPPAGVLVGTALSVVGVVAFVVTSSGSAVSRAPVGRSTTVAAAVVAAVVLVLTLVGLSRAGTVRCVVLAMAGATAFGLVSALVRAVSQSVIAGDVALLDPPVLGAAAGVLAATAVGGWLVQQAYHSGPPEVVIACLTVLDPVVAVLLGALVLSEGMATTATTAGLLIAATLCAAAGVVALAHHHPDARTGRAPAPPEGSR
jgi:drug/metabolite transporter (DMT)-like permease